MKTEEKAMETHAEEALHCAFRHIQEKVGVECGGFADMWVDKKKWDSVVSWLSDYEKAEKANLLTYAEDLERRHKKHVSYECVYENTYRPEENETTHISDLCEMQDDEMGYPLERLIDDIEKYGKAVMRIGYATTTITPRKDNEHEIR